MSFRQVDRERYITSEISLMEWSPTMDLIALVTVTGEVHLHRLSWQRVWVLPSRGKKDKDVHVTAIAWRPDGKVLAVAYDVIDNIFLADVENSETIHLIEIPSGVTALKWVECSKNNDMKQSFYTDTSSLFLPKYYSLVKNYTPSKPGEENLEDSKRVKDQECMNILAVGTDSGTVHLYAFGMFHCGHVDVEKSDDAEKVEGRTVKILSVSLSDDFSILTTFLETTESDSTMHYDYRSFSLPLLREKTEEFRIIALKYGQIASLLTFLSATIRAITEAWEDILLEIDTKLLKYAEKKGFFDGTLSEDFLELLMFGTASNSLENFLLHDLTENGLKKFGHSIELSYSNIQKLVLKKLQNVASSLFYNLSDVKGMALWKGRFGELGLSQDNVKDALSSVGSFLMKATEIQQVIDCSMKNFKAFFRWLYSVILRLSDEPIPSEITKVTQQDLNFVAEFLMENFTDEWNINKHSSCKLERVGQYLRNEKLSLPPNVSGNPWISFLEKNPALRDSDMIFPHHPELSLVQQHQELRKAIELAFCGPRSVFASTVSRQNNLALIKPEGKVIMKITQSTCVKNNYILSVFTKDPLPGTHMYIVAESIADKRDIRCLAIGFNELPSFPPVDLSSPSTSGDRCSEYKICDMKFYNTTTVSVLLVENNRNANKVDCPVLLQLPLEQLCGRTLRPVMRDVSATVCANVNMANGAEYVDKAGHKRLENCKSVELAVSGSRKVACVLFASRRQVRLFEMEVEDDEDDAEEPEHEESLKKFERDDPFESPVNPSSYMDNGNKENSP